MLKQGSFIRTCSRISPATRKARSRDRRLRVPNIDGNVGAIGGGDTIIVFDGSPENVQVVKDWITPEWQCTLASASAVGLRRSAVTASQASSGFLATRM